MRENMLAIYNNKMCKVSGQDYSAVKQLEDKLIRLQELDREDATRIVLDFYKEAVSEKISSISPLDIVNRIEGHNEDIIYKIVYTIKVTEEYEEGHCDKIDTCPYLAKNEFCPEYIDKQVEVYDDLFEEIKEYQYGDCFHTSISLLIATEILIENNCEFFIYPDLRCYDEILKVKSVESENFYDIKYDPSRQILYKDLCPCSKNGYVSPLNTDNNNIYTCKSNGYCYIIISK